MTTTASDDHGAAISGKKEGIVYEIASLEDFDAVYKIFARDFLEREPMAMAAGFRMPSPETEMNIDDDIRHFLTEVLESKLSIVARDATTTDIVGIRGCKMLKPDYRDHPATGTVFVYLEDLKNFDFFENYGVDEVLDFAFLVVKETHVRRGIAKELIERSIALAKSKNVKVVVVTATNPITITMFEKMGFDMLREISISEYVLNGVKAFPFVTEGHVGRLFAKKL